MVVRGKTLPEENRRDEMGWWGEGEEEVRRMILWELRAVSVREGTETRTEGAALGLLHRPPVPSRTVARYSQGQTLHLSWLSNS